MKRFIKNTLLVLATICLAAGCAQEMVVENTEIGLRRCLEPMHLTSRVTLGDKVTFNWDVTKDAAGYNLVVAKDEEFSAVVLEKALSISEVPYTQRLEADATFYFKVQAINEGAHLEPSKWAVAEKAIKTYAVKDNLYLEASAKTSTSITLSWSKEVSDYNEVDRVEYYETISSDEAQVRTLAADEIENARVTVDDLKPSTEYTLTLFYKSAMRGEVTIYTEADTEGFTEVKSMADLRNAIKTPGVKIHLMKEGSPYCVDEGENLEIPGSLTIAGEQGTDGTLPVIKGEFHVLGTATGKIIFEGIELNGAKNKYGFPFQLKNGGGISSDVVLEEVTFRNCVITGYSKGLIYEWGQPFNIAALTWDGCDIIDINKDGSGGGDVIDFRGTADKKISTLGTINIVNNTIVNGGRAFFRIDFPQSLGEVHFDNNTIVNICVSDNTNNVGIIGVQTAPANGMTFCNNLLLSMGEKAKLGSDSTLKEGGFDGYKYWNGIAYSNNYYYDVTETFFNAYFTASTLTELKESPCENIAAGRYNLTNADLVAAKVGAPKWWTPYVEQPEDLTLLPLEGAHTWNLGDAKYFSGTIKKEMVRDGLYINGSEENPIVVDNGSLVFKAASVLKKNGSPETGYLAFKVSGPGSVLVKAAGEGTGHLVVGTGSATGGSLTVKGGAAVIAESTVPTKIPVTDITEETIIYVYASDAISLAALAWSTDTTPVNTALPTPVVSIEPGIITQGEALEAIVSWEAVPGAGSYSVVFNEKTYSVDEDLNYTIASSVVQFLDAGGYPVSVYANPTADDIYNTQSAAAVVTLVIQPKSDGGASGTVVKTFDELSSALAAGKDEISIADGATIEIDGGILPVTASLTLKGGAGSMVKGGFKLSGAIDTFVLDGLRITGDDASACFIECADDYNGTTLAIKNSEVSNFGKSLIYYPNANAVVQEIKLEGNYIHDFGTGQDFIDFRKGTVNRLIVTGNTFEKGIRTFVRMDAAVSCQTLEVTLNTLYGICTIDNSNNNGLLHVRASVSDYKFVGNIVHSVNGSVSYMAKNASAIKPGYVAGNFFYGINEEVFFSKAIGKEDVIANGGAVLSVDPLKDAANGDYTVTSALVIAAGAGDPKWNPATSAGSGEALEVSSVDALFDAIAAGKTSFVLAAGDYDLGGIYEVAVPLSIKAAGDATIIGGFKLCAGVDKFVLDGIKATGNDASICFIECADTFDATAVIVKNCEISRYGKSLIYYPNTNAKVKAVNFSGNYIHDFGTGHDFIDFRKGTVGSLTVADNTFEKGIRTFVRMDSATACEAIAVTGNTLYNVCTIDNSNNNGLLHVRASVPSYTFVSNLVHSVNGTVSYMAKNSSAIKPTNTANNFFYGIDEAVFFSKALNAEDVAATVLAEDPCKNASAGDYTVVNSDVKAAGAGASRWR